jgi:hypothetical protein
MAAYDAVLIAPRHQMDLVGGGSNVQLEEGRQDTWRLSNYRVSWTYD